MQFEARLFRQDDPVDEAPRGRLVGVGEGLFVAFDFLRPRRGGVARFFDFPGEDDVGRPFGSHDGDFRLGPGQDDVRSEVFAAHAQVAPAVGFPEDEGDFGDRGLAVGVEEFRPVADDASRFLRQARQVARNVFEGDDGDVVGVADADVAARLVRGVDVEASRHVFGLVGDDADDFAPDAAEAGDDVLRPVGLDLEEVPVVDDFDDDVPHVVAPVGVGRHGSSQLRDGAVDVVFRLFVGRLFHVVARQVGEQFADLGPAFPFVGGEELGHSRDAVVRHGPADLFARHFFSRHRFDDGRARDVHDADLVHHEGEVRQSRAVDGTARAGTGDDRDLRHDPAGFDVAEEDVPVAREGVDGLLDARSARVVDSHDGHSVLQRHVHDFADFLGVHLAQRSAQDGEVLAVDVDEAALYGPVARHHSVSFVELLLQTEVDAAVRHEFVDLDETPLVQQRRDTLSGRHLSLFLLLLDGLRSASLGGLLPARQQRLAELVDRLFRHASLPPRMMSSPSGLSTENPVKKFSGN